MSAYGFLSASWWQQHVAPVFNGAGVPESVYAPIALAESGGNPSAAGDCPQRGGGYGSCSSPNAIGGPTSYGVYQLHQNGGQGTGYTATQLTNPATNAQIAVGPISQAYERAKAQGLSGVALLIATAHGSGHTIPNASLVSAYNAYQGEVGNPKAAGGTGETSSASSSGSSPATNPATGSPLADTLISAAQGTPGLFSFITNPGKAVSYTMTELFGALIGIVFIAAGVWALVSDASPAKAIRRAVGLGPKAGA